MDNSREDAAETRQSGAERDASEELDRELVYHYSRAHRLSRAPKRVRDWVEKPLPKRYGPFAGLFTALVDTKPKAALLILIAIICVIMLLVTYGR